MYNHCCRGEGWVEGGVTSSTSDTDTRVTSRPPPPYLCCAPASKALFYTRKYLALYIVQIKNAFKNVANPLDIHFLL